MGTESVVLSRKDGIIVLQRGKKQIDGRERSNFNGNIMVPPETPKNDLNKKCT